MFIFLVFIYKLNDVVRWQGTWRRVSNPLWNDLQSVQPDQRRGKFHVPDTTAQRYHFIAYAKEMVRFVWTWLI
jgi:hypothetical protein